MNIMEPWRQVFRDGITPSLSYGALQALAVGLRTDDSRLVQGQTTVPPPLMCVQDWPCYAACVIGYCGWQGEAIKTVGEVEEYFARVCHECEKVIEEPAACRHFLNWFDETPRDEMRRELLAEVELEILSRDELATMADDNHQNVMAEEAYDELVTAQVSGDFTHCGQTDEF